MSTSDPSVDGRGRLRGHCLICTCARYDGGSERKDCVNCLHKAGKHQNMSSSSAVDWDSASGGAATRSAQTGRSSGYPSVQSDTKHTSRSRSTDFNSGLYCHSDWDDEAETTEDDVLTDSIPMALSQHSVPFVSSSIQSTSALGGASGGVFSSRPSSSPPWRSTHAWSSYSASSKTKSSCARKRAHSTHNKIIPPPSPRVFLPGGGGHRPSFTTRAPPASRSTFGSSGQQICKLPGCGRTVYIEQNGRKHDFCGKTHATQYGQPHHNRVPTLPQTLRCKTPGCMKLRCTNPQGGFFDYCSRSCRDNGSRVSLTSASTPNLQNASGYGTCAMPGCTSPNYCDPVSGRIHPYCGRTHAMEAKALGLQHSGQVVIRSANSQEFVTVTQKFRNSWHKGTCPNVDYVYMVRSVTLETRWSAYRQQLGDQTIEEHYHGTKLTCDLYSPPCNNQECGICGISNTGLDRRCIRKNVSFQRFGHGFYLAPNSSKCHDYTQGANGYRAMLLCDVCPGNKYFLQTNKVNLTGPPPGYDCVYGQVGESLNFPEIVVYNSDAVIPRYIIVYQKDGIGKIAT